MPDTAVTTKTASKLNELLHSIRDEKFNIKFVLREYLNEFRQALLTEFGASVYSQRTQEGGERFLDEIILERLEHMKIYRDEFIGMANQLCRNRKPDVEHINTLVDFFGSLVAQSMDIAANLQPSEADHFVIFNYELFIYFIATLLHYDQFDMVYRVTHENYPVYRNGKHDFYDFSIFRQSAEILDRRNERLKARRINPLADIIKERATSTLISFEEIMQAEYVLTITSVILGVRFNFWYPHTLLYCRSVGTFKLFADASLKRNFGNIKALFGARDRADFIEKITNGQRQMQIPDAIQTGSFDHVRLSLLGGFESLDTK